MSKTFFMAMLLAADWSYSTAQDKSHFYQEFSWSPDGKRICFSARTEKEPYEIYAVNADGSGLKRLTNNAFEDYWTSWAPDTYPQAGLPSQSEGLNLPLQDGSQIAFNSNRDGNYEIYIMNADGANPVRLTDHPEKDIAPSISPDGKKIAFSSARDGNLELYVMNLDGSGLKRLTNTPGKEYNPQWSPDGKKLVYYYEKGDRKDQIYIINTDGSKPKAVTNNLANNIFPAWMPDGRKIIFTSNLDSIEAIYSINTNGSDLKKVKAGDLRAFFARFSLDGSKLAVITGGWPSATITIMNADGTNPVPIEITASSQTDPLTLVKEFMKLRDAGEKEKALAYFADTAKIWFEKKEGPGRPWKLDGPWTHWDEFFNSKRTYRDWKAEGKAVSVIINETNDYYRLLDWEPSPVLLTWWLDGQNKIAGYMVKGLGEEPSKSRMKEFKEWAQSNRPEELAYLMPEGNIKPEDDRAERWKKVLIEWRAAVGLEPIQFSD